jgi:DNA-binding protein HU-beta
VAKGMTKSEVIKTLAEKLDVDRKKAAAMLEHLVGLVVRETKKTGELLIPGLGKAVKAHRKARLGRNPATGETIKIPAKTVVKFRLAKAFKDAVIPPKK